MNRNHWQFADRGQLMGDNIPPLTMGQQEAMRECMHDYNAISSGTRKDDLCECIHSVTCQCLRCRMTLQ